jgi:homoserine O-acetyltransferase
MYRLKNYVSEAVFGALKLSVFSSLLLLLHTEQIFAGGDHQIFNLGNYVLESGVTLPDAKLSYVTHGTLNTDKSNAILLPSFYAGDHHGYDFLIGPSKALDPAQYFIVTTDMFGNGQSSSPSNTPAPFDGANFPEISTRDNVGAGYRLLTEQLGVKHLKAVIGFSMGAQQAFQWAVSYPTMMDAIVPYCGSAKEYPHGVVRLEGFKSAIMADAAFEGGNYKSPPMKGLKASGRHWAAWGFSQEWYRQELYKQFGHQSVEEHLQKFWEAFFGSQDANNLITQAITWQKNNVGNSRGFNGDHEQALRSIKARVLSMPCQTDLYFPPEYAQREAQFLSRVKLLQIPSIWGHIAGLGINATDNDFITKAIKDFLK